MDALSSWSDEELARALEAYLAQLREGVGDASWARIRAAGIIREITRRADAVQGAKAQRFRDDPF